MNSLSVVSKFGVSSFAFFALFLCSAKCAASTNLVNNDSTYDVRYARLELTVPQPDTEYIEGNVTLGIVAHQLSVDNRIQLSLRSLLSVDSVFEAGKRVPFSHEGDSLFVMLGTHYQPDDQFDVRVYYHGYSRSGAFIHTEQRWELKTPHPYLAILWTNSEPYGSKDWWPCKDNPAHKLDSVDLLITCPPTYSIASNGLLRSVVDHDTSRMFSWHESYPIDHYLVAFVCTQYDTVGRWHHWAGGDSTLIESFVFPTSKDTLSAQLRELDTILDVYESWFGPYPFRKEKYGIAQWHGGGMENQTLSFCNDAGEELIAHETAHQWFGDGVTCKTWNDCWLNEGFATYTTDLFLQHKYGGATMDTIVAQQEAYITSLPGGAVHTPDSLLEKNALYGRLVYSKGSMVLHMLRYILGSDTAFFRAIREYMTGPLRYGVASADDFRASVEKSSGMDLKWFFDQWVYGEGYPIYKLAWNPTDPLHPAVAISQTGSVPSSPFFRMPIELEFRGANFDTIVKVLNDKPLQPFAFSFTKAVSSVTFDPYNWILDGQAPRTLEVRPQGLLSNERSVTGASGHYDISFRQARVGNVTIDIFDVLGRRITRSELPLLDAGEHTVRLSLKLPSGEYFCLIQDDAGTSVTHFLNSN